MELADFNSSLNSLLESSSIKNVLGNSSVDLLFDSLMCLRISMIALKLLKSFLSGLILINLLLSSFSKAFCLSISRLISLPS